MPCPWWAGPELSLIHIYVKNIKLRIVYLILCSALLLFALFMLAVNLIIPAHFVREAKKALISEAEYQNRTIPYTDDESFFDDEWNDTEEHFLTPSIVFLELDNANQSSGWNKMCIRDRCSEAEIFTRDSVKKAKISTGMYTIYHQGGIMAGYSTDVRSIAAIRFIAILFPSPYCSRITGGCQLSSAVISGT